MYEDLSADIVCSKMRRFLSIVYKTLQILSNARLRTPYCFQRGMISYECSLVQTLCTKKIFLLLLGDIRPHDAHRPITGELFCLMDHNLRCHPVLAGGCSKSAAFRPITCEQKDLMDHNLSYYTCARFKFPSKGM